MFVDTSANDGMRRQSETDEGKQRQSERLKLNTPTSAAQTVLIAALSRCFFLLFHKTASAKSRGTFICATKKNKTVFFPHRAGQQSSSAQWLLATAERPLIIGCRIFVSPGAATFKTALWNRRKKNSNDPTEKQRMKTAVKVSNTGKG